MSDARGLSATGWQDLYRRLGKPLYNFAYRYVWSAHEAEDVVHDAFLQVWQRRTRMRPDTSDRYLWVAVLNLCRKRRRWSRARRFLRIDDSADELAAADDVEAAEMHRQEAERLRSAIDALPETQRAVLLLAEFSDLGYEEIARMLSIPAGTVASRRHLAMKRLREMHRSIDP